MVVLIVPTIIVAGFVYKRFTKRRARQRASKLAALNRAASPANVNDRRDESPPDTVIASEEISPPPPPYPNQPAGPPEGPLRPTVPEPEYPETYVRDRPKDRPPPYSTAVFQVQNP